MGELVEKVARAICWKNGMDPDLTLGGDGENFLWHEYEDKARAAILAVAEWLDGQSFSDADLASEVATHYLRAELERLRGDK